MTLDTAPPAAPAFEEMMTIYRVCVQLQQGAKGLLEHAEEMAAIAINAGIAAARSKGNQRALSVLASEASRISMRISSLVSHIQAAAATLAKLGLYGVLKCRQALTMTEARRRVTDADNSAFILAAVTRNEAEVAKVLHEVDAMRQDIIEEWRSIGRQNSRITQIASAFRIEATRDDALGDYFAHIATLLAALSAQIKESSGQLHHMLDQFAMPTGRRAASRRRLVATA